VTLIATENAMLSAPAMPYFVSLAPLTGSQTGGISYGGSGRMAGFALTSTDNVPIGDIARLLAHEYAHRWFGHGWGPYADGAGDYWFTEGFTDWFASHAMVKSGLWTPEDWREAVNMMLLRYASSTARDLTDAEVTSQFWTNQDAMQVQYDRGNLAATLLDTGLRKRGTSLLTMLSRMGDRHLLPADGEVDRLNHLAGAVLVAKARGDAAAQPLPHTMFGSCGALMSESQPAYDRGFTVTGDQIVDSVRPESPAWMAGVRSGFRFVRRTLMSPGDASKPYAAEFLDGETVRRLSWLPAGERRVTYQRLPADEIKSALCAAIIQ
jgi:predicted metalloprotease with PDZ domain